MPNAERDAHTRTTSLPEYDRPPVNEVVCGISFHPLTSFRIAHFGQLWERFKPDYRQTQEVEPLSLVVEKFTFDQEVSLPLAPPLPRIWFIHKNGTSLIQVQRDRFLVNWRKVGAEQVYPRFPKIFKDFKSRLARFESYLSESQIGNVIPLQYELTYVNQLTSDQVTMENLGEILPDFAWHASSERFLPGPEDVDWSTIFAFPARFIRLHVRARTGRLEDKRRVLMLELTARGMPADRSREAMDVWFGHAREAIVRGFADFTSADAQQTWGRRDGIPE